MSWTAAGALTGRDISSVTDAACEQALTKAFGAVKEGEENQELVASTTGLANAGLLSRRHSTTTFW